MLICLHIMIFFMNTVSFKAVVGRKIEINVQEENFEYFKREMSDILNVRTGTIN